MQNTLLAECVFTTTLCLSNVFLSNNCSQRAKLNSNGVYVREVDVEGAIAGRLLDLMHHRKDYDEVEGIANDTMEVLQRMKAEPKNEYVEEAIRFTEEMAQALDR